MSYGNKSLEDYSTECFGNASRKGFYETRQLIEALIETSSDLSDETRNKLRREFETIWSLSRIALIMSELGEMCEAVRKPELRCEKIPALSLLEEELADTQIRLFDFAGSLGVDLENAVRQKMFYNETRPKMHGKQA